MQLPAVPPHFDFDLGSYGGLILFGFDILSICRKDTGTGIEVTCCLSYLYTHLTPLASSWYQNDVQNAA